VAFCCGYKVEKKERKKEKKKETEKNMERRRVNVYGNVRQQIFTK